MDRKRSLRVNELGYKTRAAFEEMRWLQGLPNCLHCPHNGQWGSEGSWEPGSTPTRRAIAMPYKKVCKLRVNLGDLVGIPFPIKAVVGAPSLQVLVLLAVFAALVVVSVVLVAVPDKSDVLFGIQVLVMR